MPGINKAPIVDGLESVFFRIPVSANPRAIGRGECVGVIFQNPLLDVDGETTNTAQVWIGNSTDMIWLLIPGQESPLVYAEDLKDIYVKLLFPFPNPNGVILTLGTVSGSRGTGYTTGDVVTIVSPGGTDATATVSAARGAIVTATLFAGGALYTVGDVLTVTGGGGNAAIVVDTVDGGGAVLTFHITAGGTLYLQGVAGVTGGTGAGAQFNKTVIIGEALGLTIVTGGTLFAVGGHYAVTGPGNDDAIAIVDTISDTVPGVCNLCCLMYRLRKGGKQ